MTADENVAIMQRAYDAFNSADLNTLTELFDESAVWHLPGRSSMANDYHCLYTHLTLPTIRLV
jgi:ketosteroid isomerase-like protein